MVPPSKFGALLDREITPSAMALTSSKALPGYCQVEDLLAERAGQRSIRLSKSFRAIYTVKQDEAKKRTQIVESVLIEEMTKNDY
jgi:hypothetical protein